MLTKNGDLLLLEGTDEEANLLKAIGVPRISFTHAPLTWESQTAEDLTGTNTVAPFVEGVAPIIIVRHPLDTLVSHYMHNKNQAGHETRHQFADLLEFIESPIYGIAKFCKFYSLWSSAIESGKATLVRYEDLKTDARITMMRTLGRALLPINTVALDDAIAFASFDNMKKLESGDAPSYQSSGFRVFATGDKNNPDAFHVRRGVVGGYRNYLSAEQIAKLESFIKDRLASAYGY